jgi:phospholipase C
VNVATFDHADWRSRTPDAWFWSRLGAVPSTFMEDLARKTLPKYSFIEPRYSWNWAAFSHPSNSDHPGGSNVIDDTPGPHSPPTDTAHGQALLLQIYNALRGSSYWERSLLIITYDEHGGTYDHAVPPRGSAPTRTTSKPPIAIPPAENLLDCAADGFDFRVLGGRVPAIVVSPHVARGSTIRAVRPSGLAGMWPFDHTSIIRTLWDCLDLTSSPPIASLTERDAAAPSLMPFLTSRNDIGPCPVEIALPTVSLPARGAVTLEDYIARRRGRPDDRRSPQAP